MGRIIKPELLAPAGTIEGVRTALEAGADAVYVGGKHLNMRQHRASYNLSDEEIAEAVGYAHRHGKKLYFTLNSLIRDSQLGLLRTILKTLGKIGPDAIIVQDLGVASLARELCVQIPLHASTMMNVHNLQTALTLKMMGFTRIIPSRDIPIHEIRRIAEQSGMEMESFIHGDMCISQSSLCYLSGIAFGESANCGRCMKPCRWNWKLIIRQGRIEWTGPAQGYLLARKDLCLFEHIPALIQNGIRAFKIEGRMRTAEFVAEMVGIYRKAIDSYIQDPAGYATSAADMYRLLASRVREFTAALTFTNPGLSGVDPSGTREPRFFSTSAPDPTLSMNPQPEAIPNTEPILELIVQVSNCPSAQAALDGGADAVYLNGQGYIHHSGNWEHAWLNDFLARAASQRKRIALMMPQVTDERDMMEWTEQLERFRQIRGLAIGVSNLGGLMLARNLGYRQIIADFSMNICNAISADELSTLGVTRVTASVELALGELVEFVKQCRLPVEIIAQGPLSAMLMEHCVIAAASGASSKDICPMHCRKDHFDLQDVQGQNFPLVCDRRCRNHIFTSTDVCALPKLGRLAQAGIAAIRIEAQLDDEQTVKSLVLIYRNALDTLRTGQSMNLSEWIESIRAATGRNLSDGALKESLR